MSSLKRLKVAVDPGHGGYDPGAVSPLNGVYESTISWDLAMRLTNLLRLTGHQSYLTRLEDAFVSVSGRPRSALQSQCEYFVSLHCNSASSDSASGLHIYYHGNSDSDKDLALNIKLSVDSLTEWQTEIRSDFRIYPNSGFGVLRGLEQRIPGVLIEYGFLTNQGDLNKIMDPLTRQTTMLAVLTGVLADHIGRD